MPVSHAVILGIIQGLTEALPVSSSAHLVIFPWIFKWHYQGISFDIALHAGTAAAFSAYFFRDWIGIFAAAFKRDNNKKNILRYIIIGTIPAVFAGFFLEKKAETAFRSPAVIAAMLAAFAVILWLADHLGRKERAMEKMTLRASLIIGLSQALAIIPGVSRSGITMTAGLFEGFSRASAARFSFLLATPIVFAAAALKLTKLHAADFDTAFWAGLASSAIGGFFAIHFLLKFVRKANFNIFVFYRIALAVTIIYLATPR